MSRAKGDGRPIPAILLAAALAASGCGGEARVPLHPATGTVLVDGQPAGGVLVRLYPSGDLGNVDALRPFATTGDDGGFQVGTFEKGDGAPVGVYKATLFLPDRPLAGPGDPVDLLGDRHTDPAKSEFEVKIAEGPNRIGPFQVKKAPAAKAVRRAPKKPDFSGVD